MSVHGFASFQSAKFFCALNIQKRNLTDRLSHQAWYRRSVFQMAGPNCK